MCHVQAFERVSDGRGVLGQLVQPPHLRGQLADPAGQEQTGGHVRVPADLCVHSLRLGLVPGVVLRYRHLHPVDCVWLRVRIRRAALRPLPHRV